MTKSRLAGGLIALALVQGGAGDAAPLGDPGAVRLEVGLYRSPGWATSATFGPPPVGTGAYEQGVVRYFPPLSRRPGTAPITIEASPAKTFSEIWRSKPLTPKNGVIAAAKALELGPFAGPGDYVGPITTWYLRAKAKDGKVSNTVTLTYTLPHR